MNTLKNTGAIKVPQTMVLGANSSNTNIDNINLVLYMGKGKNKRGKVSHCYLDPMTNENIYRNTQDGVPMNDYLQAIAAA